MYFLYSLLLSIAFAVLSPYFAFQAVRHGKYRAGFRQRMGRLPESLSNRAPTVWIHAVSVGELLAAQTLIERLNEELPDYRLVVSTTTGTGQKLARERLRGAKPAARVEETFYFPFDWRWSVRSALDRIRPAAIVILETELWPNFLRECRRREIPTVIANGRISERSFRGYLRIARFISRVIRDVDLLIMQTDQDANRARSLGAPAERVMICGNMKYDTPQIDEGSKSNPAEVLDRLLGLSRSNHLVVAGSTAAGEEEIVLEALKGVRVHPELSKTRLVIAPRHPERFDEVANLLARSGLSFAKRSTVSHRIDAGGQQQCLADVILLDTIGELAEVYRYADAVFVGGSLVPRGGHNILEPAAYARAIIVGCHTENFRQIVSDFSTAGAVIQIGPEDARAAATALSRELTRVLLDRELADEIGARAQAILKSNRGATDCTASAIRSLLKSSSH